MRSFKKESNNLKLRNKKKEIGMRAYTYFLTVNSSKYFSLLMADTPTVSA